eukprot:TCALIF_05366-PA protein Name:"Similar to Chchd2 Coiled-coil-helix-coiled-coil-helix domain-containing protein 2, mitochondrial (Mus musculus)" AED:0.06 eAED:0.06 QI:0/0/0/1/1/1/2/0/161
MPRRGRAASPPRASSPAPRAAAPRPAAPAPTHAPSQVPAHAPPAQPMMGGAQPQPPSLMKQASPSMAVTAGGVAVGSAVGHTMGHAMTGMFSGGGSSDPAAPAQSNAPAPSGGYGSQPNEPTGACAWEIKQFIQCAQNQSDLSLCEGFNEALRQCKQVNGM